MAWGDFVKLRRLWSHTSLHVSRKIQIFNAVIISRLLYGIASAWLNASEVRRLNGFQSRCLRKILGIQPAFFSRISNAVVLSQAAQKPYGQLLLRQQLVLFGKVARASSENPLRYLSFVGDSFRPLADCFICKQGRPCNDWTRMVLNEALRLTGSTEHLTGLIGDSRAWRSYIEAKLCFLLCDF